MTTAAYAWSAPKYRKKRAQAELYAFGNFERSLNEWMPVIRQRDAPSGPARKTSEKFNNEARQKGLPLHEVLGTQLRERAQSSPIIVKLGNFKG